MDAGLHERLQAAAGARTFRHLSEITGVNAESVRRYMQGHAPSVAFVSSFCRELGVNAHWLLTGRGPMRLADVKREALADAGTGDLMSAVAGTLESLIERVDRLDVYTQSLEVKLRASSPASAGPTSDPRAEPTGHDERNGSNAEAPRNDDDRTIGAGAGANGSASGNNGAARPGRAQRIGRAAAQRPRPDAD